MNLRSALRLRVLFLLAALWITPAMAQNEAFTWRVELDAPEDVRALLQEHLDVYRYRGRPGVDTAMLQRLVARSASDAQALLATAGYFSPQVEALSTPSADSTAITIQIKVAPGPVARVSTADIKITGAITGDPAEAARIEQVSKRWRLQPGIPFRQAAWDEDKEALLREFVFDGYPAARIASSTAEVDPESARVLINVTIDSGPLFRFGSTRIEGLQRYPRHLVANLQHFHPGERYNHEAVVRYQTELQASGFFRSASVVVDTDTTLATAATVLVRVVENPEKKVDLGVGLSTDTGPRAEAQFTHYNTFQPGWQGTTKLRLDAKEQTFNGELALTPETSGWSNRLGAEAVHSDIENLTNRRYGLPHSARGAFLKKNMTGH